MRIQVLTEEAIEQIHQATLRILEETGARFPSPEALTMFADAGAMVDFERQIVKIPHDLLIQSLANAPRTVTMASRGDPDLDLYLDGTKTYIGTDGTGVATVDLETRTRRGSTKRDVAMMALICDYLPSISFFWPLISAQDVPSALIPLHELEASFLNTEKHVELMSCSERFTAAYAVEIAEVIAGGSRAARERPPLSLGMGVISPLSHDKNGLEAALTFASAGLPVAFGSMPTLGSTAPASLAGTLAIGNAEILSGLCLIQLAYPGTPVCYALYPEMLNVFTGECLAASPLKSLLYAAGVQMGHRYNIPVKSYYGATDAHKPGKWVTGKDNAIDALMICLAGPDLIPAMGLLEAYTLLCPEKILLDHDIFDSVKAMTEGIRVDSDTLAIDEIMAVGPGGHFLDRDYTCKKIRELWQPGIVHQWSAQEGDFRDPQEVAVEKVRWILENHRPRPLDDRIRKELERIIKTAERELVV